MGSDGHIAIEIKVSDLYEWKDDPQYPHKIGFREGKVLYECYREGSHEVTEIDIALCERKSWC